MLSSLLELSWCSLLEVFDYRLLVNHTLHNHSQKQNHPHNKCSAEYSKNKCSLGYSPNPHQYPTLSWIYPTCYSCYCTGLYPTHYSHQWMVQCPCILSYTQQIPVVWVSPVQWFISSGAEVRDAGLKKVVGIGGIGHGWGADGDGGAGGGTGCGGRRGGREVTEK